MIWSSGHPIGTNLLIMRTASVYQVCQRPTAIICQSTPVSENNWVWIATSKGTSVEKVHEPANMYGLTKQVINNEALRCWWTNDHQIGGRQWMRWNYDHQTSGCGQAAAVSRPLSIFTRQGLSVWSVIIIRWWHCDLRSRTQSKWANKQCLIRIGVRTEFLHHQPRWKSQCIQRTKISVFKAEQKNWILLQNSAWV